MQRHCDCSGQILLRQHSPAQAKTLGYGRKTFPQESRLSFILNTNQPLCRGFGGGTRPPIGGLGGSPPILVSPKNDNFSLKSVPLVLIHKVESRHDGSNRPRSQYRPEAVLERLSLLPTGTLSRARASCGERYRFPSP